jgi:hypothetical protein
MRQSSMMLTTPCCARDGCEDLPHRDCGKCVDHWPGERLSNHLRRLSGSVGRSATENCELACSVRVSPAVNRVSAHGFPPRPNRHFSRLFTRSNRFFDRSVGRFRAVLDLAGRLLDFNMRSTRGFGKSRTKIVTNQARSATYDATWHELRITRQGENAVISVQNARSLIENTTDGRTDEPAAARLCAAPGASYRVLRGST